jgi:hypothetical protein
MPDKYQSVDLPKKYQAVDVEPKLPAMQVPPIDPLTGRTQTAGRTMSQGETLDYALATIPTATALIATAPISSPTAAAGVGLGAFIRAAALRSVAAGVGGGVGSVLESSLQSGMDTPGAPKTTADVINRAVESGVTQSALQGLGEGIGLVGPATVKAGQKFAESLPRTRGGMQYLRGKWDEIKLAADARRATALETAGQTVDDFRSTFGPHEVGETAQDAATVFRKRFVAKEAEGYRKMEEALAGTKIDYRDVAQRLIELEKKRPKATGGMAKFTEPENDWAALVKAMEEGQKPTVVPGFKGEARVRGPLGEMIQPGAPGTLSIKAAPNAEGAGDAILRARSTISQRLWDIKNGKIQMPEGHTREYAQGLEELLKSIDQKIIGAAHSIDPLLGEGYRELLKFSGSNREIMKHVVFRMSEENKGDLAKTLLSSRHPENVNVFMELAKSGQLKADDIAGVQRAGLESMLLRSGKGGEKVMDIESFAARLSETGEAGKRLFADPKAKATVDRLAQLSREVRALPKKPSDVGLDVVESNEAKLMELVAASAGFKLTNLVFLPREGYRMLTKQLMKIADNPNDYKKLHSVWQAYQTGAMTGSQASKHAMNLFRVGKVATGVAPLVSSHEPQQ